MKEVVASLKNKRIIISAVIVIVVAIIIGAVIALHTSKMRAEPEKNTPSTSQIASNSPDNKNPDADNNKTPSQSPEQNTPSTSANTSNAGGGTPDTVSAPFEKSGVIVVNKKHPLPRTWAPGENAEAVAHLKQFISAAQNSGDVHASKIVMSWSGFRSFETQAGLYANYVNQSGLAAANTFSAKPGYSEHQSGLAFDLKDAAGKLYRSDDDTYNYASDWVANHAHEYGFIIRYRDEWTPITGYVGEPWHLRYLGVETASAVKQSGKTLEEFLGVPGGDYEQQ
jgi:D-alanyl-D-alanine carboxypeptidase